MHSFLAFFFTLYSCGYPCPRKFNPSDHYINTLAIVPGNEENCRDRVKAITAKFNESDQGKHVQEVVEYEKSHVKTNKTLEKQKKKISPYRASW